MVLSGTHHPPFKQLSLLHLSQPGTEQSDFFPSNVVADKEVLSSHLSGISLWNNVGLADKNVENFEVSRVSKAWNLLMVSALC
jgi:hypothetical protein